MCVVCFDVLVTLDHCPLYKYSYLLTYFAASAYYTIIGLIMRPAARRIGDEGIIINILYIPTAK